MSYKFEDDETDEALIDLLDYISDNTGLRGSDTIGRAQLSAGGVSVLITGNRPDFDRHSPVLDYIQSDDRLRINNIGRTKTREGVRPSLTIKA